MKSLLSLVLNVLSDAETWCCTSAACDINTITSRYKHEGVSFLTITLPAYCSDFERSLDLGRIAPNTFLSFRKRGDLPLLLGGFLELVFDRDTGMLLDDPSLDAIFYIRQITLMAKKILLPCTKTREKKAYDNFIECEKEVVRWEESQSCNVLLRRFHDMSSLLWSHDLSIVDRKVYEGDHVPKHGPGTTAERIVGNNKFNINTWTERLDRYFPVEEFVVPNSGYNEELSSVNILEPGAELPVRVITVPKTLKTPRIIAIEPLCMQYAQQSLLEILVRQLESSDFLSSSIGFTDQIPNQWMAQLGSTDGSLATIDLSDASDRVSYRLVKTMLSNFPSLAGAIDSCRSTRADVPGHGVIPLSKYASMGSATCFPIEAMVFLTIICLGIQDTLSHTLTRKELSSLLRSVRVYGDDIIVPTEYVRSVTAELSTYGMKVNTKKSFWTGKFRESCGKDFYDGSDVTVVYLRREIPKSRSDASEMISAVSFRNQLYMRGLWKSAAFMDTIIRDLAKFPNVLETSPVLGRRTFLGYDSEKSCPNLHRPLVRGLVVRTKDRPSPLGGVGALMKFFLKRGTDPVYDAKHLERYGRPLFVDIKTRWDSAV